MSAERGNSTDDAWSRVLDDWSDEASHRAFVDECLRSKRLDLAAKHYGDAIRGHAIDYRGATARDAERRLAAVVKLAQNTALVPSRKPPRALLVARTISRFAFGALVLVGIVFLVLHAISR